MIFQGFGNACVQNLTGGWDCGKPYGPPPTIQAQVCPPICGTVQIPPLVIGATPAPAEPTIFGLPRGPALIGGALLLLLLLKR